MDLKNNDTSERMRNQLASPDGKESAMNYSQDYSYQTSDKKLNYNNNSNNNYSDEFSSIQSLRKDTEGYINSLYQNNCYDSNNPHIIRQNLATDLSLHNKKDIKPLALPCENISSSSLRRSLNNSLSLNHQLSPKLSPIRNSLSSVRSCDNLIRIQENEKLDFNQPLHTSNVLQENTGLPIQVSSSNMTHIYLSEQINQGGSLNRIIFKENKLNNTTANNLSHEKNTTTSQYNFENQRVTPRTDIFGTSSGISTGGSSDMVSNYMNWVSSPVSKQVHIHVDGQNGNGITSRTIDYSKEAKNISSVYYAQDLQQKQAVQTKLESNENSVVNLKNMSAAKEVANFRGNGISNQNIIPIGMHDKMKGNDLNQSLSVNEMEQVGKNAYLNMNSSGANAGNVGNSSFSSIQQQFGEFLSQEDQGGANIHGMNLKQQNEMQQKMYFLISENENLIAYNEVLMRENRQLKQYNQNQPHHEDTQLIKEQSERMACLEEERRRLEAKVTAHDKTAREQLLQVHQQSVEQTEKLLFNTNLERKTAEQELRRQLEDSSRENQVLRHELSILQNQSTQIKLIERERTAALQRVTDIENKCETLTTNLSNLNSLLQERLDCISSLEATNQQLLGKINSSEENKLLKNQLMILQEKNAALIEDKFEQEQLVNSYKNMTEESQKMNTEYLHINEANIVKIQELEDKLCSSHHSQQKIDEKDTYISSLIQTFETEKLMYQKLIEEIRRLENNHRFELDSLKNRDAHIQKIQELNTIISENEKEREQSIQEIDRIRQEHDIQIHNLMDQLEEEKQHNLEQIQNLKIEISNKSDNLQQLQEFQNINEQLITQLDVKEKEFQQAFMTFEERINQEVHNNTYQLNIQLTNIKSAMRQLEEDNNQLKLDLDIHYRELERQRIRNQDLINEKEQITSSYERQIHTIASQSERTIHNIKTEKEREMVFLQREHQRMQVILQEKLEVISKIQSYQNVQAPNANTVLDSYQKNHQVSTYGNSQNQSGPNNMILRRNTSLTNINPTHDENTNMSSTIKRQSAGYMMPPLSAQSSALTSFSKSAQQQHLVNQQRHSSLQTMSQQSQQIPNIYSQNIAVQSTIQQNNVSGYDTSIVDENDKLNKLILERCKNIVEGKTTTNPADNANNMTSTRQYASDNQGINSQVPLKPYQSSNQLHYRSIQDRN